MELADKTRIAKTPIENKKVLNEAYDYPKKVSFVRGMRVELDNCVMLFISGTASVDEGGESIHPGDIRAQTRRALTNIKGYQADDADLTVTINRSDLEAAMMGNSAVLTVSPPSERSTMNRRAGCSRSKESEAAANAS